MKAKIGLIVSCLLLWASAFIQWHFIRLCLEDGEVYITEPVVWLRWFEMGLNSLIVITAFVALVFFWYELIKERGF